MVPAPYLVEVCLPLSIPAIPDGVCTFLGGGTLQRLFTCSCGLLQVVQVTLLPPADLEGSCKARAATQTSQTTLLVPPHAYAQAITGVAGQVE